MTTLKMDDFFFLLSKKIFYLLIFFFISLKETHAWCFLLDSSLSDCGGEKRCMSTLSHLQSAGMFTQAKQELFSRCC